jgi:hypothetical protein
MSEPKKPNLYAAPYVAPVREVVELTDPREPEWRMTIELQAVDVITEYAAEEIAQEMRARYLEGNAAIGLAAQPFRIGGKAVKTTAGFWEDVAYVAALQPESWSLPFDHYEPTELAALAFTRRAAWRQIGAAVRRLCAAGAAPDPNAAGGPDSG